MLIVIGATEDGKKELLALSDGYRESEQAWYEVLLDLKRRGLRVDPKLAVGDGALGFWKALPKVFPATVGQRCWVHYAELRIMPKARSDSSLSAHRELVVSA